MLGLKRRETYANATITAIILLIIDALIGDEEQNGREKQEQKERKGEEPQPSYPGLYDPQWSHNDPIFLNIITKNIILILF